MKGQNRSFLKNILICMVSLKIRLNVGLNEEDIYNNTKITRECEHN